MQRWGKWQVNELAAKQQNKQLPDDLSEDRCSQKTGVLRRQVFSEDRCSQKTGVIRRQALSEDRCSQKHPASSYFSTCSCPNLDVPEDRM